jgi:hypothetical protein
VEERVADAVEEDVVEDEVTGVVVTEVFANYYHHQTAQQAVEDMVADAVQEDVEDYVVEEDAVAVMVTEVFANCSHQIAQALEVIVAVDVVDEAVAVAVVLLLKACIPTSTGKWNRDITSKQGNRHRLFYESR